MKELAIYVLITSAVWTYNIMQYRWSNTNIYIGKQRGGRKLQISLVIPFSSVITKLMIFM
jgi:hypothetical protein